MRHFTILRLLIACFLLYFAWPFIPQATLFVEKLFWGIWLSLFLLVVGGNFATLLQLTDGPALERERTKQRDRI